MATTTVFVPQNGQLVAIRAKTPTPALLVVQGLNARSQDILLTSFSQQAQVAHQVTQTVGGPEYLFVFGDMLQDLSVGVVVYARGCDSKSGTDAKSYKNAWDFYTSKRVRPGSAEAINLTFAGIQLRGMLVGFSTQADSSAGHAVIRGTMQLKGWTVSETGSNSSSAPTGAARPPASGGAPTGDQAAGSAAAAAAMAAAQAASAGVPMNPKGSR